MIRYRWMATGFWLGYSNALVSRRYRRWPACRTYIRREGARGRLRGCQFNGVEVDVVSKVIAVGVIIIIVIIITVIVFTAVRDRTGVPFPLRVVLRQMFRLHFGYQIDRPVEKVVVQVAKVILGRLRRR